MLGEKLKLKIIDIDHFGRGIAKIDDLVVFVNNTLKGDEVLAEVIKDAKNYKVCKVLKYFKRSNLRTCKECKYSDICNCSIIDMDYNNQILFKKKKLIEIIKKISGLDININDVITSNKLKYRNKAVFHFNNNVSGFYKENTSDLIDIDNCIILDDEINNILKILKQYKLTNEVMIRVNENKEIMVCFSYLVEKEIIKTLEDIKNVVSIYVNNENVYGKKYLEYKVNNYKFNISPKSFFQVNLDVFSKTLDKIKKILIENNATNVLDLYCGVGVIGISISDYVKEVRGIEIISDAVDNALENKKINNIKNIDFKCGKVEKLIDNYINVDTVIIDPPRKGIDDKTIIYLKESLPGNIIYLSCNPSTLARDINKLKDLYNIKDVTLIDMFPNTYHVETVCLLSRRQI